MIIQKIKKSIIYQRRERYKRVTKKRIILVSAIIISIIAYGVIAKIKFESNQEKIYTKAEVIDNAIETKDNIEEESIKDTEEAKALSLDNSGYLPLDKDSNADDAITVFHTTEKLLKEEIKYPVRTDGKKVAYLTFDDGPSTTNTPKVLDTLKENGIKATFLIMGKNAELSEQSKEILRRTAREGHAIGNHTYSHDYNYLYPNRVIDVNNFMTDVDKCNQTLKGILGKDFSTRVIRFPGGYWSWEGRTNIRPVIDEQGYAIIDWNTLSEDAEGKPNKTAEELTEITRRNLDSLGPNADSVIILMHDTYGKEETAKSVQPIINIFKEKGFEFRTIK
ncbi:polysaccharide deacetylase [Clostridium sp. SHJSY1]|uniref:polysaccharide deacetylase family protein n=1 Tax=Clostridium sp. SHJSY1 TaxID=2942483 RepID=UPI002874E925|nr:polysaccharide deacetylase family protein [Clostridium sp. SHJSY1]MDS0528581.1 polysaccharide deacetylase [Clostridium sp. SHJSY1]